MTQIKNLGTEKTDPSDTDLIPIQESNGITRRITRANLLKGIGGGSGNGSNWQVKNTNYTAQIGEQLILDSSNTPITITLPANPVIGSSISFFSGSIDTNLITINFNNTNYRGKALNSSLVAKTSKWQKSDLIFLGGATGWVDYPKLLAGDYGDSILSRNPSRYLQFNEISGTTANDSSAFASHFTYVNSPALNQSGLLTNPLDKSILLTASNSQYVRANGASITNPQIFTIEAVFKTTSVSGGLCGFGSGTTPGSASATDRNLYLSNGRLVWHVFNGGHRLITSPNAYNDGLPHIVSVVQNGASSKMFVDKVLVVSGGFSPEIYNGWWIVAYNHYPGSYFNGNISEWSYTPAALSDSEIIERHATALG